MINKVMNSVVPKAISKPKGDLGKRFLKSETLGKVLDVAAENPTICQSLFALAICVGPRPLTNFAITEDKQDATYASCHSIASGGIGFVWPLIFATPIAAGVKKVAKNPTKYLNASVIEKMYPSVKVLEEVGKDGKLVKKVAVNDAGKMLRKDGSILCQSNEPLMVYGEEAQRKLMNKYPEDLSVDKSGVVRSKKVFKTEGGVIKRDKDGNPIGAAVQAKNFEVCEDMELRSVKRDPKTFEKLSESEIKPEDFTPVTEEMEIGAQKEHNLDKFINMIPDIMLAPIRASLTIALIPPLLGLFGIQKKPKAAAQNTEQKKPLNIISQSNNNVIKGGEKMPALSSMKKGGA